MFGDFFSVTRTEVSNALLAQATNTLALITLLVNKGIITEQEYQDAQAVATHQVDQWVAAKKEAAQKEFDEQHPGVRQMFGKFLEDAS